MVRRTVRCEKHDTFIRHYKKNLAWVHELRVFGKTRLQRAVSRRGFLCPAGLSRFAHLSDRRPRRSPAQFTSETLVLHREAARRALLPVSIGSVFCRLPSEGRESSRAFA